MSRIFATRVLFWALAGVAHAQSQAEYRVPRATEPPRIDGVLDDAAWTGAPMPTGAWASYNPNRGDAMPDHFRIDVRVAYDDRAVYFAFHCFDNEPDQIRTTVTRRDRAFSDDWLAISLDSAGTGQTAYHLFTNPSGSQMDAINTSASGEQFDADVVWHSAGQKTADGYVIEVQIPLQTLRFAEAEDVRMGLVLMRKVSRIGYSYAWPEMLPGQWVFDRPAHLVFNNLKPRRLVDSSGHALLKGALEGIETRWGSIEAYLDRQLGVGPAGVDRLRVLWCFGQDGDGKFAHDEPRDSIWRWRGLSPEAIRF